MKTFTLTGIGQWAYHAGDKELWEGEKIFVEAIALGPHGEHFQVHIRYKDDLKNNTDIVLEQNFYLHWREECVRRFCQKLREEEN